MPEIPQQTSLSIGEQAARAGSLLTSLAGTAVAVLQTLPHSVIPEALEPISNTPVGKVVMTALAAVSTGSYMYSRLLHHRAIPLSQIVEGPIEGHNKVRMAVDERERPKVITDNREDEIELQQDQIQPVLEELDARVFSGVGGSANMNLINAMIRQQDVHSIVALVNQLETVTKANHGMYAQGKHHQLLAYLTGRNITSVQMIRNARSSSQDTVKHRVAAVVQEAQHARTRVRR